MKPVRAALVMLGLLLSGNVVPAQSDEFWCEGVDDDADGEVDEGCGRVCPQPYVLVPPRTVAPESSAVGRVRLVRQGTGLAFAYEDTRTGTTQVYVRVTATSGAPDHAEFRVSNGTAVGESPALAFEDPGGFGFVWVDERDGNREIYFRDLDATGAPTAAGSDIRISSSNGSSLNPDIVWTGAGFGVVWDDVTGGNRDIFFRRLDPFGTPLGQALRLMNQGAVQELPSITWDGTQYAVGWTDERDGNREIYVQRISGAGALLGSALRVTNATGSSERPDLVASKPGDFSLVWQDGRSGTPMIRYARWQGPTYGAPADLPVSTGSAPATQASVSTTGGEIHVGWRDERHASPEAYVARVGLDGASLSDELRLTTGADASNVAIAWHGGGTAAALSSAQGDVTDRLRLVLAGCAGEDADADGADAPADCNDQNALESATGVEVCDAFDNDCNQVQDDLCRGTCRSEMPSVPTDVSSSPDAGSWPVLTWDGSTFGTVWQERETQPGCCIYWVPFFRRITSSGSATMPPLRLTGPSEGGEDASLAWTGREYGIVYS